MDTGPPQYNTSCDFGHAAFPLPAADRFIARDIGMQSTPSSTRKIKGVLDYMQTNRVTLKDVLFHVTDDQGHRCTAYRRWVFNGLELILTWIDRYKRGRGILRKWVLAFMCKVIDREMREVKNAFTMKTAEITRFRRWLVVFQSSGCHWGESPHPMQTPPACRCPDGTRKE